VRELLLGGFSGEILVVNFDVGVLEAIELRANRHEDARILSGCRCSRLQRNMRAQLRVHTPNDPVPLAL
jgi:hypothetical protein